MPDFIANAFDGELSLQIWFGLFVVAGLVAGIATGFFKARKIQPRGFKWHRFRMEAVYGVINVAISGTLIAATTSWLQDLGWIVIDDTPVSWWVAALQFAVYFFLFDTWFYWLHRWMHKEPVYTYVHKLHHLSTSPNLLTTISVNPLESFINGGFVPLFTMTATLLAMPVSEQAMFLIGPTNVIMGLYVHSGYEFFPRWWNRSWATKWFITATFHDQHHKYFNYNFGGYTTIWDRICGTKRKKFEADFEKIADRRTEQKAARAEGARA